MDIATPPTVPFYFNSLLINYNHNYNETIVVERNNNTNANEINETDSANYDDGVPPLWRQQFNGNFSLNLFSETTTIEPTTHLKPIVIELNSISWLLALYSIIFLLAIVGNSLVILTLVQNKRMRTITNLFLLNLAVSDLFLGVFCMPFTLVGTILRNFIFGEIMCKLLPFLQGNFVEFF